MKEEGGRNNLHLLGGAMVVSGIPNFHFFNYLGGAMVVGGIPNFHFSHYPPL